MGRRIKYKRLCSLSLFDKANAQRVAAKFVVAYELLISLHHDVDTLWSSISIELERTLLDFPAIGACKHRAPRESERELPSCRGWDLDPAIENRFDAPCALNANVVRLFDFKPLSFVVAAMNRRYNERKRNQGLRGFAQQINSLVLASKIPDILLLDY